MTAPGLATEIEKERLRLKRKTSPPKPESAEHRGRRLAVGKWNSTASIIWTLYLHHLSDEELLWFAPRHRGGPVKPTADDAVTLQTLQSAIWQRQAEEERLRRVAVGERLQRLGLPVGRFW